MKQLFAYFILSFLLSIPAYSQTPGLIDVQFFGGKLPTKDIRSKRIAIKFENSPKITEVVSNRMKSLGYLIVSDDQSPDETIIIEGFYVIEGSGSKEYRGDVGKLAEAAFDPPATAAIDSKYPNGSIINVGLGSAVIGKLSVEEVVKWVGAETGIASFFNSLFTSKEAKSRVYLRLSAPSLYWSVDGRVSGGGIDMADLFSQTLQATLNPLFNSFNE